MNTVVKVIYIAGLTLGFGAGSAIAADLLPTHKAPAAPYIAPAPMSWTGFYVGVNGGYGGNDFSYPFAFNYADPGVGLNNQAVRELAAPADPTNISGSAKLNSSGFLGGVQAGYNWQFASSWVAGVEGDLDLANITGKLHIGGSATGNLLNGSASATIGSNTPYIDTARLRLGYLVTPQFLVYGTGGLAYGETTSSVSGDLSGLGGFSASKSTWNAGWTAGGGAEFKITKNWSLKAEYLYADLGTSTVLSGSGTQLLTPTDNYNYNLKVHTTDNIMRVGVNYSFN